MVVSRWLGGLSVIAWMVVASAGCHTVFDLEVVSAPQPVDAASSCWDLALVGNEDSDRLVDGCDRCPGDAEVDPAPDNDLDGVGDACDPRDGAVDAIVAFDGFDTEGAWTYLGGSWQVTAGQLAQTDTSATRALAERSIPATTLPTVQAVLDFASGSGTEAAGIWLLLGTTRVECVYRFGSGDDYLEIRYDDGAYAARMPITGTAGKTRIQLQQTADGTFACTARRGTEPPVDVVSSGGPSGTTAVTVGLVTRSNRASAADWIAVYDAR